MAYLLQVHKTLSICLVVQLFVLLVRLILLAFSLMILMRSTPSAIFKKHGFMSFRCSFSSISLMLIKALGLHNLIKQWLKDFYQCSYIVPKPINNFIPIIFVIQSKIIITVDVTSFLKFAATRIIRWSPSTGFNRMLSKSCSL